MTGVHPQFHQLSSGLDATLYYDEISNTIRRGPDRLVPKNLLLSAVGNEGLLYVLATRRASFCHIDDVYDHQTLHLRPDDGPPNLAVEDAGDGAVSINFKGKYLSCGAEAEARFSSDVVGDPERFRRIPIEPIAGQPSGPSMRPPSPGRLAPAPPDLNFILLGPFGSHWSLASVNRRLALEMERSEPGRCRIITDENPPEAVPEEQVGRIAELRFRPPAASGTDIAIHQRWPVVAPPVRGDLTLAYFFWEESRVPADAVAALSQFDAVLVSADFVGQALVDSGLSCPVATIGYSPDLAPFQALYNPAGPRPNRPLTFLHISSSEHRKGLDVLALAYARCFHAGDPVRLIIKGQSVLAQPYIDQVRERHPSMAEIILIDEQLGVDRLVQLYGIADVMVLPTRGEGFNVPAAEAIAAGLQLIVTGYGGHMQFCRPGVARFLKYRLTQSLSVFTQPNSLWAEPDLEDLCAAMLEARAGLNPINHAAREAVLAGLDGRTWTDHVTATVGQLLQNAA